MKLPLKLVFVTFLVCCVLMTCSAKKKRKTFKSMVLREKETNPVNFIRLAVMRLVYGIATRIGMEDEISEVLNGAFVPPGVDDDNDYGGFGLFRDNGEDDDDYDY